MEDKRDAILQATQTLISQRGFHGTPMSMIADQAEVGAGTIYRYFENKDALINELFLKLKAEMSQAMMRGLNPRDSTEHAFRKVWLNTFRYCVQNPEVMLFMEQYHNSPFQTPQTEAAGLAYLEPIVDTYQQAIRAAEIKDMPFEMLTAFTYDVAVGHAKRHIAGVLVMDEARLELAVQACWDAIKAA
jgi:AcrR family transcriptional regulator